VLPDEDDASSFLRCLRHRKMYQEFSKTSIKAMSLSGDIRRTTIIEILSLCTGINNLTLQSENNYDDEDITPLLQVLNYLPLTVLSLQIEDPLTSSSISNVTVFTKLTHLEIDDADMLRHLQMECFPQLTHLSLWGNLYHPGVNVLSLVNRLLSHPTLQVLIFRVDCHRKFATFLDRHGLHDPRIILAPARVYLWDSLGRACMLLWELAEEKTKLREPNHSQSISSI
jgi:hypothetical protein